MWIKRLEGRDAVAPLPSLSKMRIFSVDIATVVCYIVDEQNNYFINWRKIRYIKERNFQNKGVLVADIFSERRKY